MDRAARAALRLPPVARLALHAACLAVVLATVAPSAVAAAVLPPAPQRVAIVCGRSGWQSLPAALAPPPGRWQRGWAERDLVLPPLRSPYGRASRAP